MYIPRLNPNRRWGIEIELISPVPLNQLARRIEEIAGVAVRDSGYTHARTSHWKVVTDGSVHPNSGQARRGMTGGELVSPPLKGAAGLEELKKVCDALEQIGCQVNRTCGLHVHHEAPELQQGRKPGVYAARLLDAYAEYEGIFDMMMPPSRREDNSGYAHSLRRQMASAASPERVGYGRGGRSQTPMSVPDVAREFGIGGNRYEKVNLEALTRHGTVEFRQHSGTVEFPKMETWITLTQLLYERVLDSCIQTRTRRRTIAQLIEWLRLDRDQNGDLPSRDEHAKKVAEYFAARFRHFCELAGASADAAR